MLQLHFTYRNCTGACFQVNCPSCRFVCLRGFFSHCVYLIWVLRPPSCWTKILLSNEVKNQQKSCKNTYICNCTCNMSPLQNFERKYHFYTNLKIKLHNLYINDHTHLDLHTAYLTLYSIIIHISIYIFNHRNPHVPAHSKLHSIP